MVYPTGAAGKSIITAEAVWTLGNYYEVVPTAANLVAMSIGYILIESCSAAGTYELVLYQGTTEFSRLRFSTTDPAYCYSNKQFVSADIPAATLIQAKIMSDTVTADTVVISISYKPLVV